MRALAVVIALATVGCAGRGAHYGLGYEVSNGAALLPPTAARGTSTAIVYHEQGGVLARTILIIGAAMGVQNPNYDQSTTSRTYREGDYLVTETITTTTPTSPEEKARREAANAVILNETIPGLARDTLPVELDWAFYNTGFGIESDTRGQRFSMMYQLAMTPSTGLSFGLGLASITYVQREVHDVADMGTTLSSSVSKQDLTYSLVGMPVKITTGIANRLAMYLQWDLNIYSLIENQPSPFTLGLHYMLPVLSFKASVQSDRLDARATTLGLEAILGF